ncbi:MAG: hypothetical protein MK132_06620 [Lentisphaerales bacterium]|nr:hypothetical protein [Lentisphaerales bacterium]
MLYLSRINAFKVVLLGLLLSWFIKGPVFYFEYVNETIFVEKVHIDFFPDVFVSPYICCFFYYLPLVTLPILLLRNSLSHRSVSIVTALIFTLSSFVLMQHQSTYNDATFVVSFWVASWLFWYALNIQADESFLKKHARRLGKVIISVIFLGGFIGKCTSEWWSGTALFGIYENFFNHWPFTWLKSEFSREAQQYTLGVLSKVLICVELIITSSILWKDKFYYRVAPCLIFGITFFRGWQILSVIGPLLFLIATIYFLSKERRFESSSDNENLAS